MTATLDQTQADLPQLVERVRRGEEVVILQGGLPVARLTALPSSAERAAWLEKLARLRAASTLGAQGVTSETLLGDLRAERGA